MNTFWVHKNWKWQKENATAKYIDEQCEEAVTLADAQATIAALQAERDTARRRVDELEAREVDVVLLREDLEKRTAELEAANRKYDDLMKIKVSEMEFIADEQNRLETLINDTQAELERVSLLSSHNERRFEMLEEKYKELRTLILALPKVEGEIRLIHADDGDWHVVDLYDAIFTEKSWAESYAALLKHRQGMEG